MSIREHDLEVLAALEPHTSEILSVVHRDKMRKVNYDLPRSPIDKNTVHADYLSRVDGDDYVVSVSDSQLKAGHAGWTLRDVIRYDMYATGTEQSKKWASLNQKIYHATRLFRPLFAGHVLVSPRDAFDIHSMHSELSRGMVGYTLRRGTRAILHTTGNFTEDADFFLRAVHAVNPENTIDPKTHFTPTEERKHNEIYRPIINKLEQLVRRDGLTATDALDKYIDQAEEEGLDISRDFLLTLDISSQMEPAIKHAVRFATYRLGKGNHLMIEHRSVKNQSSIRVVHEYAEDGETVNRTYEQPWGFPNMIVADMPSKSITNMIRHDKRLFALRNSDALELNAILSNLL